MNTFNYETFLEQLESFSPYPSVFSSHVFELLLTISTSIKLANLSSSKRGNSHSDSEKFITKLSLFKSPVFDLLKKEQEINNLSLLIMKMPKTTDDDILEMENSIEKLIEENINMVMTLARSTVLVLETIKNYKNNFNKDNLNDINLIINVLISIYNCSSENCKNLIQQLKDTRLSLQYIKTLDSLQINFNNIQKK